MSGKKGRSGRKRDPEGVIANWIRGAEACELPAILDALVKKAKEGDLNAAMYVCNRILGTPRQQLDATVRGALVILSPSEYELIVRQARDTEIQTLIQPQAEVIPLAPA